MTDQKRPAIDITSPLPPALDALINAIVEGRVKQFAFVAVMTDDEIFEAFPIVEGPGVLTLLGGLEVLKREILRVQCESRVKYLEANDEAAP